MGKPLSGIITEVSKYIKGWSGGGKETPCGFGSRVDQTRVQREWIPRMVEKYDIRSISDIGAGDLNWLPLIEWPHSVDYKAFDLVPRVSCVERFDIIYQTPKPVDCLLCLWVLNHLPENHAERALANLRASGSKYLIYTWWPAMADFLDLGAIDSTVMRVNGKGTQFEIRIIEC